MRLKHVSGANEIINGGRYYISDPTSYRGKWTQVFQNENPLYIEIGMGKGDFIIENAIRYPEINFIGIEKYDSVLVRAIQKSNELELKNLRFIRMDALAIDEIFCHEVELIYLNFSDPWPKARHAKRRLTSPVFLEKYKAIFNNKFHLIMKTDNAELFDYSLETLKKFGCTIISKTKDLYAGDVSNNIPTEYEKKFVKAGIKIHRLEAIDASSMDKG